MTEDQDTRRESGQPGGGAGHRDVVGGSGVYPASAGNAPDDAEIRIQAAWGQGERGAAGYHDSGRSELSFSEQELRATQGQGGGRSLGGTVGRANEFLFGVVVGAGLMYLLDPDRGKRRRALVRDQVVHAGHELGELGDTLSAKAQHVANQARGAAAETQARLRGEDVDDFILQARVRSEIGRAVSNPGAVHVTVNNGRVALSGPVLASEVGDLLSTVRSVRGVEDVRNLLDVHERAGRIPALQGAAR